jgi:hypothetical protein
MTKSCAYAAHPVPSAEYTVCKTDPDCLIGLDTAGLGPQLGSVSSLDPVFTVGHGFYL